MYTLYLSVYCNIIYVMNPTIFVAPAPGGHREFQQRGPGLGHCGAVAPRGGVDAALLAQRHGRRAVMAGMWRHFGDHLQSKNKPMENA